MDFKAPLSGSLLDVLGPLFPDSSKNSLRQWIKDGRIQLNSRTVKKTDHPIKEGALISFLTKTKPLDFEIKVLYEDRDLVVIEKPEGFLSVSTAFEERKTAHNILKRRFYKQQVYPVHRLDRETSGVMVYAYSQKARDGLKEQFKAHSIHREYRAIVEGKVEIKKGTWTSHLKESASYHVSSHKNGRIAITHYEQIAARADFSYLKLTLETGRKNQVRVHASEAGYPIVGDLKYGAFSNRLKRLALHAYCLVITHPVTGKKMKFISPVPQSFEKLFAHSKDLT